MSPRNFFNLLSKLTPCQQAAIRAIDFGVVRKLEVKDLPRRLGRYLVEKFDYCSHSLKLESGKMDISENDVFCTLGFPQGEREIVEARMKKQREGENFAPFVKEFKLRWSEISSSMKNGDKEKVEKKKKQKFKEKEKDKDDEWPLTNVMCKALENRDDHGDDFKVDFVVCLVSSIIKGQQNYYCNSKVLYSLMNVDRIKELNWCDYIFRSLVSSVEDWKKSSATSGNYFKGPLLFLLLCYVDRVEFKTRDVVRKFPTCCGWTTELLRKRASDEEKEGFGKGHIVPHLPFDSCQMVLEKNTHSHTSDNNDRKVASKELCAGLDMINNGVLKVASVISQGGHHVDEKSFKATNAFNTYSEFFNKCSTTEGSWSQDSDFWEQPDVIAALDESIACATIATDMAFVDDSRNPLNGKSVHLKNDQLSHPFDRDRTVTPPYHTITPPCHTVTPTCTKGDDEDVQESVFEENSDRDSDYSLVIGERARRCQKNLSKYLRSPYWTEYGDKLGDVHEKERIVSDYCFIRKEEWDDERFFSYKSLYATREDMFSLSAGEQVCPAVIDLWSLILNIQNLHRAENKPHRVFFSTTPVYHLLKRDASSNMTLEERMEKFCDAVKEELKLYRNPSLNDAELVLFPVWNNDHYFLVCCNFLNEVIQYIDNKTLPAKTSFHKHYAHIQEILDTSFGNVLLDVGCTKSTNLISGKPILVKI